MLNQPEHPDRFECEIIPQLQQEFQRQVATLNATRPLDSFAARVRHRIESDHDARPKPTRRLSTKRTDVIWTGGLTCAVCMFLVVFDQSSFISNEIDQPLEIGFTYSNRLIGLTADASTRPFVLDDQSAEPGIRWLETGLWGSLETTRMSDMTVRGWIRSCAGLEQKQSDPVARPFRSASLAFDTSGNQVVARITSRLLGY